MHGVIVVANFRATFTPETVYYHLDPLGSVRAVTSAAGAVVERHDYRPFGEDNMPLPAPGADPSRFLGQQRDQTKLDQFGARYYSMFTGRFTGVDPVINAGAVASPQRWNRYAYALNDPLRFTDASGLDSEDLQQAPEKPSKCPAGQLCFRGGVAEAWIPDLYFLCSRCHCCAAGAGQAEMSVSTSQIAIMTATSAAAWPSSR